MSLDFVHDVHKIWINKGHVKECGLLQHYFLANESKLIFQE